METSQGKSCSLPSVPAGFTTVCVWMPIGPPRPWPGYPATLAFYPVSVRRVRVLPPGFLQIPPHGGHPCPRLAVPVIAARRGLLSPGYMTCLAHHHEGGKSGGPCTLQEAINWADIVLCPVDVNSHDACRSVKVICKKTEKPYHMMPSSGVSSVARVLAGLLRPANKSVRGKAI